MSSRGRYAPVADLDLAVIDVEGRHFETGVPVTFPFIRRPSGAVRHAHHGALFGQDIEPAGRYVTIAERPPSDSVELWETGTATLHRPLVLWHDDYGPAGWKARLSQHFRRRGALLSHAIRRAGFDGIVTVARALYPGRMPTISETVLL